MSPEQAAARRALHARIHALITRLGAGERDDAARDAMLVELAHYQARWVAPYARFVAQRRRGAAMTQLDDVPALPTDAFRFARISSREARDDLRIFESSGTTHTERSKHSFADLSLYDLAAERAARYALFPDCERMRLVILAPREDELSSSSLSYMLARFVAWFGTEDSRYVWPVAGEHVARLEATLREAERDAVPVALLGTSFAFVHALDALGATRFRLAKKSRIMQTGGFKGRAREVAPDAMRAWLAQSFGIAEPWIVAEYGMTELSSQLYENTLREAALSETPRARQLWAPPWLRAVPVDPEALTPVAEDRDGLVRIDDLANLDSVAAIQTADLATRVGHGLVLRGRALGAVPRGCSITADELLGGS